MAVRVKMKEEDGEVGAASAKRAVASSIAMKPNMMKWGSKDKRECFTLQIVQKEEVFTALRLPPPLMHGLFMKKLPTGPDGYVVASLTVNAMPSANDGELAAGQTLCQIP